MTVLRPLALIALTAIAASTASARKGQIAAPDNSCVVTRILPDGREVRSAAPAGAAMSVSTHRGRGASASASSRSLGRTSVSSSSSSASSSSSSGRRSFARAVSSYTDDAGRTVTTTRDGRGCTIVIDERDFEGEE